MQLIDEIHQNFNLVSFIERILTTSHHRVIILFCRANNNYAHGFCLNVYHKPADLVVIEGLFEDSFRKLEAYPGSFWEQRDLPLIEAMGLFQLTFIEKTLTGKILLKDGLAKPFSYHLGID